MSTPNDVLDIAPGNSEAFPVINAKVNGIIMRVKKITTTDESKLQVVLETEGFDELTLDQLKDMLTLQQTCPVSVSMVPVQRDMFDS